MHTLTFRQPRLVALFLLIVLAAGASALLAIGRQEDPTIINTFATVTTVCPGAEPARVESLVTAEVEEALRGVTEVDALQSVSATGISVVQIELQETLEDGRIEQVWSGLRSVLSDAEADLPPHAQSPELYVDGVNAFGASVAITAAHGGAPMTLASRYGDALADRLLGVPGTKAVEVFGSPEEEVSVVLDTARAAGLGLSVDEVATAIAAADAKVRAGRMTGADSDLVLEVSGEIETLDRLRGIVLRDGPDGTTLQLGDIAQIDRGSRQPLAELALHDGRPAIPVAVALDDGLQIDVWAGFVRDELATFAASVPGGLRAELVFDQSTYTADRLAEVGVIMAIGIALVLAVLLVTLGLRAALLVATVLPLATLFTMNLIGLPIHQMSVTGQIVALGLLVDAGIVMTDEVGRRLRDGATRPEAVRA